MYHKVVIIGMGAAALTVAARLYELGISDIGIFGLGSGASPELAAINFVLPGNPYNDTKEKYAEDILNTGYQIGNKALVEEMAQSTVKGFELLVRWGVEFAKNSDGSTKLRHVSGHTFPRSLCSTERLIGIDIVNKIKNSLKEKGIKFYEKYECVKVLSDGNRVYGITVKDSEKNLENIYSEVVIAGWGGAGNLFGVSTYPDDIKGNTLSIAKEAGAELVDLEFLEFEPLVIVQPKGVFREPCPTAMLGEGGYLLNNKGERFLLKVRPQGEAGSPKTLINKEVLKEIKAGNGTEKNGVYLDLRHIDVNVLKGYPWFYNKLIKNGVDPNKDLIEVSPISHSLSGGIKVNNLYESTVKGFYAVGEACGGVHGACRCAGNAGSQAVISGLLCGEAIANTNLDQKMEKEFDIDYKIDKNIYEKYVPKIKEIAVKALGIYRDGKTLEEAKKIISDILEKDELAKDTETLQIAESIYFMLKAASERKESRGTHMRLDYPEESKEFEKEITI